MKKILLLPFLVLSVLLKAQIKTPTPTSLKLQLNNISLTKVAEKESHHCIITFTLGAKGIKIKPIKR